MPLESPAFQTRLNKYPPEKYESTPKTTNPAGNQPEKR